MARRAWHIQILVQMFLESFGNQVRAVYAELEVEEWDCRFVLSGTSASCGDFQRNAGVKSVEKYKCLVHNFAAYNGVVDISEIEARVQGIHDVLVKRRQVYVCQQNSWIEACSNAVAGEVAIFELYDLVFEHQCQNFDCEVDVVGVAVVVFCDGQGNDNDEVFGVNTWV